MEQTPRDLNKNLEAKTNTPKTALVEVTRTFHAPVERVFNAWSSPDVIQHWWGPENFTCPEARTDFREGGKYLFAMKGPDGKIIWGGGEYKEMIPNKKIVSTDYFADRDGNFMSPKEYGMPGEWPETQIINVEFESLGADETKMSIKHEGLPPEIHDDCVQGWSSSFNKLQRVVEGS